MDHPRSCGDSRPMSPKEEDARDTEPLTGLPGSKLATMVAPNASGLPEPALDDDGSFKSRYEGRGILGEGGMGEVRAYADRRIGREVAVKMTLAEHETQHGQRTRFLHEARVQGQLEHPSIVPVYDLGTDNAGRLY